MAQKRKGQLAMTREWAKHLRKDFKRFFWSRERMEEKKQIRKDLKDHKS